jgi:hypothetical protein
LDNVIAIFYGEYTRNCVFRLMCHPVSILKYLAPCLIAVELAVASVLVHSVRAHSIDAEELRFFGYADPFGNDGTTTYTDVWGDGDYGYIGSLESGVSIIDVSGPTFWAIPVGTFVPATPQQFYDVKARDGYGYFSSLNGGGTFVVDVSNPSVRFSVFQIDSSIGGHDNVRNAMISGDYLYQTNDTSSSIHIFDISNPTLPAYVRTVDTGDSIGIFDVTVVENRLYASGLGGTAGEGAVYVYDVTDPGGSFPPLLGQIPTGVNTSSAWPTNNAEYLVVTHHELGGDLGIWDISTLSQPTLATSADASDLGLSSYSTGEVMLLDDILYVSWWEAGVQVLDLDNDLANNGVQLIGQFDTSNFSSPLDGFVGNQGVFPLLGHEKILVSDSRWGFFVLSAKFVLPPPPNYGDFDNDDDTDGQDFLAWQQGFGISSGASGVDGDADADSDVDMDDFDIWQANYNMAQGGGTQGTLAQATFTVPEPTSMVIVAVAFAMVAVSLRVQPHFHTPGRART